MQKKSYLKMALKRIGAQILRLDNVEGYFRPTKILLEQNRVWGVLETHDAKVKIGFSGKKVPLPLEACRINASGKLWLNEDGGDSTMMVSSYTVAGERVTQTGKLFLA